MIAGVKLSSAMLILAVGAGTLSVLVAALYGYTPFMKLMRDKWRAYQKWANDNLRALYSPLRALDFALRHIGVIVIALLLGGVAMGSWFYGLILAAFAGYLPVVWIERERAKRRKALNEQ